MLQREISSHDSEISWTGQMSWRNSLQLCPGKERGKRTTPFSRQPWITRRQSLRQCHFHTCGRFKLERSTIIVKRSFQETVALSVMKKWQWHGLGACPDFFLVSFLKIFTPTESEKPRNRQTHIPKIRGQVLALRKSSLSINDRYLSRLLRTRQETPEGPTLCQA